MRRFDGAPTLEVRDPLAELLGAVAPGETLRYEYADAVKLAGHSCPTVAGAYLSAVVALRRLYGRETPVRGQVAVTVGGKRDEGGAGPSSQVLGLITGAAPETGFAGLMGRHARRDLLAFDASIPEGTTLFRRTDTGAECAVRYDPSSIAASPDLGRLLALSLGGRASADERSRFGTLWQDRVAAILAAPDLVLRVDGS